MVVKILKEINDSIERSIKLIKHYNLIIIINETQNQYLFK